ncbi:MAG TPA: DUF5691 domain-containing protein [Micromonosporaceae bacterium]
MTSPDVPADATSTDGVATASWLDLVATATVGTDRRSGASPDVVLDAAAAAAVYRRAGVSASTDLPAPQPAPPETAAVVPGAAGARLGTLLATPAPHSRLGGPEGEARMDVLAEWLRLVAARRLRAPAEHLPDLLDLGRRRRDLRPLILAAGGARVRWLAAHREEWRYLANTEDEHAAADPAAWTDGSGGQRVGYLAALRRHDPGAARDLLAAEWGTLPPDERTALLGTLRTGLDGDDEEFLEAALDDRRKEVRDKAAELLARLPSSRYAARMAARARACVTVRRRRVAVDPPTACDHGMRRDGVAPRPPAGTGERAWWLEEILARTPLSTWDPQLPRLPMPDEWAATVRRGLARAAAAQGDPGWASALLELLPDAPDRPDDRLLVEALYAALPPDELTARAERALRRDPAAVAGVDRMLELCAAPWPVGFGRSVLGGIAALARRGRHSHQLDGVCVLAAVRLPVELSDEADRLATALRADFPDNYRLRSLDRLADTLRFRHDMTKELA